MTRRSMTGSRTQRMGAIMRKEWAQIGRDPSTFGIVGLLPLLLLLVFGYAVSLDTGSTRVAMVLQDQGRSAQQLAGAFAANPSFHILPMTGMAEARTALVAGDVRAILVVPQDFSRTMARRQPADVQLITDGSIPNTAAFVASHTRGLVAHWNRTQDSGASQSAAPASIRIIPHFIYNPTLKSRHYLVSGAIVIVMAMIGTMLTALVVAREWERGTMEALLATPVSVTELIIAKVLPYYLLGLGSIALCVTVAIAVFDVPFRGSVPALMAIVSAFLFAALGQGLLISAATRSQFVSTQYALLSGYLPSLLLSGFLFEIDSMPVAIQWLTWVVPARYLVPPLQTVFLAGDVWPLFWPNIAVLLGFGLFFFWRAIAVTQKALA